MLQYFCFNISNAILQYLGDKYDTTGKLYPKEPKARAIVNHRLCFNLAMYYRSIAEYVVSIINTILNYIYVKFIQFNLYKSSNKLL